LDWIQRIKWELGKWLWTSGDGYAPLAASAGLGGTSSLGPVKNKTRRHVLTGRGDKPEPLKRVDKLYYRGPRLHHEIAEHHVNKAVLPYKGKGAHDRRSIKREKSTG